MTNIWSILAVEEGRHLNQQWTQISVEDCQGSGSGGKTWGRRALDSFMQSLKVYLLETNRRFASLTTPTSTTKQFLWGIKGTNYSVPCTLENSSFQANSTFARNKSARKVQPFKTANRSYMVIERRGELGHAVLH